MADITLLDGRELEVDLTKLTRRQFMRLMDNLVTDDEASALLGAAVGLSAAEVMGLAMLDWRRVFLGVVGKGMQPLAVPNSVSASSSP